MRARRTQERLNVPLPGRIFEEQGSKQAWQLDQPTGTRLNLAGLPRSVHHGHGAVLYLRVHHQPEHGAGAALKVDLRLFRTRGPCWRSRRSSWLTLCSPSPTSKLIETIGYKRTMVVSLFIQVVGCLLFVPAAKMVSFPLFLTAVFVVGAGVTALQTSANPYVSILGPESSASDPSEPWRRLSTRSAERLRRWLPAPSS